MGIKMKKLLNTLYVMNEAAYLSLDGENVVVNENQKILGRLPLHTLESIISFSYKGASPALMGACMQRGVGLSFYLPNGRFQASVNGWEQGNVLLRKEQYRISDDVQKGCSYAQNMLLGKIFNCRWCLERTLRDHRLRVDSDKIREISLELKEGINQIKRAENMDSLRGIEGKLAERYFSVFDELIINQKVQFSFTNRSRRPPLDRVNALLSFSYTILAGDCANALKSVGLDPYVGFLHRDRPGRKSLALDIVEELRACMADRFVLTLINKKVVNEDCFVCQKDGAVLLNDKGRKAFFTAWQSHKKEKITHPFLNEKIEWGLVPYVQSLLLARTIRGDLEEYPPFFWK